MNSKKGFELSINMIVVIILGVTLMIVGITMFYNGYNKVVSLRENVDSDTQARLNNLMTDGNSLLPIAFTKKDGERGKPTDFDLGINNELGVTSDFITCISYSGTSADFSGGLDNPFEVENNWLLISPIAQRQKLLNNAHGFVPIRIVVPKKGVLKGQYVFNVVVKYPISDSINWDAVSVEQICSSNPSFEQYATTQKLYLTV